MMKLKDTTKMNHTEKMSGVFEMFCEKFNLIFILY